MNDVPQSLEALEIDLLLEGVFRRFGHDFRGYRRSTVQARLRQLMKEVGVATVSALQERVLHDQAAATALLRALCRRPAPLFDDPAYFHALRGAIVPLLRSAPMARLWVAECGSAEEVCAFAIFLAEEGLLDRTQIFATVENEAVLEEARSGSFAAECMPAYADNYCRSGGKAALADYFGAEGGKAILSAHLRRNIVWAQYSLTSDASFNEFQMIVCRHALSDFDTALRRRTLQLFYDSMPVYGVLSLAGQHSLEDAPVASCYRPIVPERGLYKRVA